MRAPKPDELAWLKKLADVGHAYPNAGDESAAAHDCKREGWSVLAMQARRDGKILPWQEVRKLVPDERERWERWFPKGEQLTEQGWIMVAEYGDD